MPLFSDPALGVADPFLRRAFELAELGRGTVSPNPLVGCVVVRDGAIVGEGFHERAGGPHAEVVALRQAASAARGAHVYVTMEPCNHVGRTAPCAPALVAAGISTVTIGMPDPNTAVSGGGAALLAEAGVTVRWARFPEVFEAQNERWVARMRTGRPWILVKVALTLDGRPALFASRRARLTGSGGRGIAMRLRSGATAVAVGAATLAVDDPSLTVRDDADEVIGRQPQRFVLARTTVPSPQARMFADGHGGCSVVVADASVEAARERLGAAGVRVLTYPYAGGARGMLEAVAEAGVDDLLIEPGPVLFTALWRDALIDELVVVTAGGTAGNAAPPLYVGVASAAGSDLDARMRAVEAGVEGDDAATVWRPRVAESAAVEKGSA